MKLGSRISRAALVTAVAAVGIVSPLLPMESAGASTSFTMRCAARTDDVASPTLGSTFKVLSLLGKTDIDIPVTVTSDMPAVIETNAPAFAAKLDYSLSFPDALITQLKSPPVNLSSVTISNINFEANASGAGTGQLVFGPATRTFNLSGPVVVNESLTGTITPTGAGVISVSPGAMSLQIPLNANIAGVQINTLSFICSGSKVIATTQVKPKGAPNITNNPIDVALALGGSSTTDLLKGVTEDNNNPVVPDSLKLLEPPAKGTVSLVDGKLTYTGTEAGSYTAKYEICGKDGVTEPIPGVSQSLELKYGDAAYPTGPFSAHPIYMTLAAGDKETTVIPISFVANPFYPIFSSDPYVPFNPNDGLSVIAHILTTDIRIPSAATIQAALEALPNIGPGNVKVTVGPASASNLSLPYKIEFQGALANTDAVPEISVKQFMTWAPLEWKDALLKVPIPGGGGGGGGGTPIPTFEQNLNLLLTGQISFDKFGENLAARFQADLLAAIDIPKLVDEVLKAFPSRPQVSTKVYGRVPVPGETVKLCSQGLVNYTVTDPTVPTTSTTTTTGVTTTSTDVKGTTTLRQKTLNPAG